MALSSDWQDVLIFSVWVIAIFILSGLAQTFWLKTRLFQRCTIPLDGGLTLSGAPIFGENKTVGGILVLPPLVVLGFISGGAVFSAMGANPVSRGSDPLSTRDWFVIGAVVAAGYVGGELLNSFVKRRFGVSPGKHPDRQPWNGVTYLVDQVDSVLTALICLSLVVTLPMSFIFAMLVVGTAVHQSFNILLRSLGLKKEAR